MEKSPKKSAYDTANRSHESATGHALLLSQYPEGPSATSLKQRPSVEPAWAAALSACRDELKRFSTDLNTSSEDLDEKSKTAMVSSLREMKALFDSRAFVLPVQILCAKNVGLDDRLKAHMNALAAIIRHNETIAREARFRLLAEHPLKISRTWNGHPILKRLLLMAVLTTE